MDANRQIPTEIGDYELLNSIGHGGFSKVFRAVHIPTHENVAIKVIPKDIFPADKFKRELEIMKSLDHPFCTAFFEHLEDDEYYYLAMELVEGGNLLRMVNAVGSLPESKCRHYFCQLISALDYLHTELQIAHRDLKVENIMIDRNDNIRLIDFGLGNMFQGENAVLSTACGSPAYAPPEMLRGKPYTTTADVWSAGIVLYGISVGRLPFEDQNIQRLVQKIVLEEPNYPDDLPVQLSDLIRRMMIKDPQLRITVPKIMEHPWFCQYSIHDKMCAGFGIQEKLRSLPNQFIADPEVISQLTGIGLDGESAAQSVSDGIFDCKAASYRILQRKIMTDKMQNLSDCAYAASADDSCEITRRMFPRLNNTPTKRRSLMSRVVVPGRPTPITPHFRGIQPLITEGGAICNSSPNQNKPSIPSPIPMPTKPFPSPGSNILRPMGIIRHNPLSAAKSNARARSTSFTTPIRKSVE